VFLWTVWDEGREAWRKGATVRVACLNGTFESRLECKRYEGESVEVYFAVGKWFEHSSKDGGRLEFERTLEIVMGVKSLTKIDTNSMNDGMPDSFGGIVAGNVAGVMVDVYYKE
jgi:hypothetical protein